MLKILFSPSEAKKSGGYEKIKELLGSNKARDEILNEYNNLTFAPNFNKKTTK